LGLIKALYTKIKLTKKPFIKINSQHFYFFWVELKLYIPNSNQYNTPVNIGITSKRSQTTSSKHQTEEKATQSPPSNQARKQTTKKQIIPK
jgi:hypothetical protein